MKCPCCLTELPVDSNITYIKCYVCGVELSKQETLDISKEQMEQLKCENPEKN